MLYWRNYMIKRQTYAVRGMHCNSCNIVIKHELEKEQTVAEVKPDYKTGKVEIVCRNRLPIDKINKRLAKYGYQINSDEVLPSKNSGFNPLSVGAVLVAILLLIPLFKYLNLAGGRLINLTTNISFLTAFLIGLAASFSTCMATTGVFFLSINEQMNKLDKRPDSFNFALLFSVGRVISYGILGGAIGLLGKSLLVNPKISGFLTVIISTLMILMALSMLSDRLTLWRWQSQKLIAFLIGLATKHRLTAPLILGAATFFMPCGFTQSLQLYALQSGGFYQGGMLLLLFALGTLPSIFGVSFIARFGQKSFTRHFSLASGILILVFSLFNVTNGLALAGVNLSFFGSSSPSVLGQSANDATQTIEMTVDGSGYAPRSFTVKKDIPVTWRIQGVDVLGCQSFLVAPELDLARQIQLGENIVEFTPQKTGQILFSCGMGMFRGVINVI